VTMFLGFVFLLISRNVLAAAHGTWKYWNLRRSAASSNFCTTQALLGQFSMLSWRMSPIWSRNCIGLAERSRCGRRRLKRNRLNPERGADIPTRWSSILLLWIFNI
jgi:hypothetical protein